MTSQRAMVAASLLRPDTSAEAHGIYPRRDLVPGELRLAHAKHVEPTRVTASGAGEPGQDGRPPTHTLSGVRDAR